MRIMKFTNRILAATLAIALLGGGVAFAGDDSGDADASTETTETTETTEATETTESTKTTGTTETSHPEAPEELVAAITSFRAALQEWRHCLIDIVTGDADGDTCGGAPNPDDYGLSEEDLLEYDLDERLAKRVERFLTRVAIKTQCIEAHASEGRTAVYECVWAAIHAESGDRGQAVGSDCQRGESSGTKVTTPTPESDGDAVDATCDHDGRRIRDRGGEGTRGGDSGGERGGHGDADHGASDA